MTIYGNISHRILAIHGKFSTLGGGDAGWTGEMKKSQEVSIASPEYRRFIEQLKARVISARLSVARAANRDVIPLYWGIGRGIVEKQQTLGWGDSIVEMVSADLRQAFPGSFGFSPQNVWRMLQFFRTHTDNLFLAQAVRELEKKGQKTPNPEELSQLVRELIAAVPWGHHANVLAKLTDPATRLYYLQATARFGGRSQSRWLISSVMTR